MRFNLFGKIDEEIKDFDSGGVYIVGKPKGTVEFRANRGTKGGYYHSQKELLESIDLAQASKFKKGPYDEQGQRKAYLNIVNFHRDVMKMKIRIKVSDYIFEPWSLDFTWVVQLLDRMFKTWAQRKSYDDDIDDFADDLSTYGTCVAKKLPKCPDRVALRSLRNTQTARSLFEAANDGGYVILDNDMHYNRMRAFKDWDLDGLDKRKSYLVLERYGLVPEGLLKDYETLSSLEVANYEAKEDEEMKLAVSIVIPEGAGTVDKGQKILFMNELDEESWPFEECHSERVAGRWIGKGEIEKQLENQIARNLNAHLRRKGILWGTRKIFQSTDENVQKNLIVEAEDGDVLQVKPNGQVTQVNTQNQHSGDIQTDDNVWRENSREVAFAFEAATGENMPSGTSFSLVVSLQKAVASHFDRVKGRFSNFLKRSFFDQIIPEFEKEYDDEHEVQISMGESDIEALKEEFVIFHTNERIWDANVVNGRRRTTAEVREEVAKELERSPYLFLTVPKRAYRDAEYYMRLNLTDDIGPELADLTSIYTSLQQKGDPRADHVLAQIMAKRGKSLAAILGPKPETPVPPVTAAAPTSAAPSPAA